MSEQTVTTIRIGQGAKPSSGGITVGRVNGGIGINTSIGSASITRNHSSSASVSTRTSQSTSSVVSTPTVANGGHIIKSTIIESGVSNISTGGVVHSSKVAVTGAQIFAEATQREKAEMQRLNERLSNYIGRVKHLEQQNKQLVTALSELRAKWGTKNDSFKSNYLSSSTQVRTDKDAATRARLAKNVQLVRLTEDHVEIKARIEEVNRLTENDRKRVPKWLADISTADSELAALHKKYETLKAEERAALIEQERHRKDFAALHGQLDGITLEKQAFQAQVLSIKEETKFLKTVHQEEIRELQALLVIAPADTKEFFKNELALAVRDIRKEYQLLVSAGKTKLETWYKSKIQLIEDLAAHRGNDASIYREQVTKMTVIMSELKTRYSQLEGTNRSLEIEVQKLQKQVDEDILSYEQAMVEYDNMLIRMRSECATLVAELQTLLDSKALLDGEIAIYRAMIDGEEKRVGPAPEPEPETSDQWEKITKTKFNTIAHGNVAIVQSEPTGKFVSISNNSEYAEEHIGGWKLRRTVESITGPRPNPVEFKFALGTKLKPRQKITIFASGQDTTGVKREDMFELNNYSSWGMGANVTTTLYNDKDEEKAQYTQKTIVVDA